jgi:hypothetical protein
MPISDASMYTSFVKNRTLANDYSAVDSIKFRGPSIASNLRTPIRGLLSKYMPTNPDITHNFTSAQRFSIVRSKLQQ